MNKVRANLLTSLPPNPAHPRSNRRLAIFAHLGNILVVSPGVEDDAATFLFFAG
jgi:hypothetical protein